MPLKKCQKDGKSGWKWGDSGTCYTGPGGKKKAIKQGIAIEGPEGFEEKVSGNLTIVERMSLNNFLVEAKKKCKNKD